MHVSTHHRRAARLASAATLAAIALSGCTGSSSAAVNDVAAKGAGPSTTRPIDQIGQPAATSAPTTSAKTPPTTKPGPATTSKAPVDTSKATTAPTARPTQPTAATPPNGPAGRPLAPAATALPKIPQKNSEGDPIKLDETGLLACSLNQFAWVALESGNTETLKPDLLDASARAKASAVAKMKSYAPKLEAAATAANPKPLVDEVLAFCTGLGFES